MLRFVNKLKTLLILGVSSVFLLAACDNGETENSTEAQDDINYSEEVDYTITGIEPGAGITEVSYDTIDSYDNLAGWNLEESSTAGMLAQLDDAIKNEEPIVFTGWVPHHMFIEYDLKMLDDPQNTMGDSEAAHTITRLGLEEDMPSAYEILDAFNWELMMWKK